MVKFLIIFSLILVSLLPILLCDKPKPLVSLNANLNKTQLLGLNNGVFITQFIAYMLTGKYDGQPSNDTSAIDEFTINNLLDVGFNQIASPVLNEQFPDTFPEVYKDINEIINRLNENGTSSVKFKEIKQYLSNFESIISKIYSSTYFYLKTALNNAKWALLFYLSANKKNYQERFESYLQDEFLGNLTGACKVSKNLIYDFGTSRL